MYRQISVFATNFSKSESLCLNELKNLPIDMKLSSVSMEDKDFLHANAAQQAAKTMTIVGESLKI